MKKIAFLFILLLPVLSVFAQHTEKIIVLKNKKDLLLVGKQTYYWEDKKGNMTFEDVRQADVAGKFASYNRDVFARSPTKSAFWFKIVVQNQTEEDAWVEVGSIFALYIDFYAPDEAGKYGKPYLTGAMRPEKEKYYNILNAFWLPLNQAKDTQAKTYYLRITEVRSFEAPLRIGTIRSLYAHKSTADFLTACFVGLMLIMILYNGFIYTATKELIYGLYIGYLVFALVSATFLNGYPVINQPWFHLNFTVWHNPLYLFTGVFCIQYLQLKKQHIYFYYAISSFIIILVPVTMLVTLIFGARTVVGYFQLTVLLFYFTCIAAGFYVYFYKKLKSARYYLLGWTFIMLSIFVFVCTINGLIPYSIFARQATYFGTALEVWMFSLALGDRMNIIRQEQNTVLEQKVQERTEELYQTQEELAAQRDVLMLNNKTLEKFKQKVSLSIGVAQTIQQAILPPAQKLSEISTDYFVLNRPRDIVSGDFYWVHQAQNKAMIMVADCTGHGVPGAFMTMIGNALLDKIVKVQEVWCPAEILEMLHQEIQTMLRQDETGNMSGMDASIVVWEDKKDTLSAHFEVLFAGAKRPIYHLEENTNNIRKSAGTRKNIGGAGHQDAKFTVNKVNLPKMSMLYLCSDGYSDQNNKYRKSFSEKRFVELLSAIQHEPLSKQQQILEKKLEEHMKDTEQRDDILILGIQL